MALAAKLPPFDPSDDEIKMIQAGISDHLQGREHQVDMTVYATRLDAFMQGRMASVADKEKAAGSAFRDKIATEDGAAPPYIRRLGVELLGRDTRLAEVRRQVREARFGRRRLGTLLLDQGFLAGVGNYLRSEILFEARLHPAARPGELDAARLDRLARASLGLARRSWRTGGVTNDPVCAAALRRQGEPFARYRHYVFDRAGEPCHACGTTILRETVTGRGLYRCPGCQPRPRARSVPPC